MFKTWSEDFIDAYLECGLLEKDEETAILRCDPEMEAQIFESIPLDVWSYAGRIQCPVLVIRGEQSETFGADVALKLQHKIPDYRLETISQAGHFVPMEQPEVCAKAIIQFVKTLG